MTDLLKKHRKIVRFGLIGGINTAIDFGILFVLKQLGLQIVMSNIISTTVAFIFSFFMNKNFAFESKNGNVRREFILFVLVTLFGLWVIQNIIIWLLMPILGNFGMNENTALLIAKLAATVVSMVWNYLLYDRLVFATKKKEA